MLDTSFYLNPLYRALRGVTPKIFNTNQGMQFTSAEFTNSLKAASIRISWDGRGRVLDNIFVERLWRSIKHEDIYLKDYQTIPEVRKGLTDYFYHYNCERFHQSLDYQMPFLAY